MMGRCKWLLVTTIVAFAISCPAKARAGGIVLITWGETIKHIADAPVQEKMPGRLQVGYKYGYFGVFWLDLWTHSGTYCVFEGNRFNPLQPAEAARLLNKSESELNSPFLYRFPLGWLVVGPFIVICGIVGAMQERSATKHVAALFQDPVHLRALEFYCQQFPKPPDTVPEIPADSTGEASPQAPADIDKQHRDAFEVAVQHLMDSGIPRDRAEQNLGTMLRALAAQPQQAPQ